MRLLAILDRDMGRHLGRRRFPGNDRSRHGGSLQRLVPLTQFHRDDDGEEAAEEHQKETNNVEEHDALSWTCAAISAPDFPVGLVPGDPVRF